MSTTPAIDGQYKAQVYLQEGGCELYIAQVGRFNVEGSVGWDQLDQAQGTSPYRTVGKFSHEQMQTMLGAIGAAKGYDVWIPLSDRVSLDWSLVNPFTCASVVPPGFDRVEHVLQEVDVVWTNKGNGEPRALFEVEHSTPVYSGLLRFNDIHLVAPRLRPRFCVVADNARRALFVKQVNRPTFKLSGLDDVCTFLDYVSVYGWYNRTVVDGASD